MDLFEIIDLHQPDDIDDNKVPKLIKDFRYIKYSDKEQMKELLNSLK